MSWNRNTTILVKCRLNCTPLTKHNFFYLLLYCYFTEIRSHGVGYFGFSRDEMARAEQIKNLKDMSKETSRVRSEKRVETDQKADKLRERLAKIRDKKREKLGLSKVDTDPLKGKYDPPPEVVTQVNDPSIPDPIDLPADEKNKILRPWDEGKKTYMNSTWVKSSETHSELNSRYLKNRREERNPEFAPVQESVIDKLNKLRNEYNERQKKY